MEKTNPNLVLEGDIEFDKRMTPETKAFVKEFEKAFGPLDATSIPLDDMRHGRDKEEKELIESLKFDNLDKPTEIFIKNPVDGYEIPAWVFKPTDAKKDAPITVFYHGGGWVAGSTQTHFYPLSFLSNKTKTIWISIEYRLAPKYKYKTQLTDYKAALEWVINNREQLSSKDAKIGVCGDSAGGHIAALMAHNYKSFLSYQILIYPVVDLRGNYNEEFKDPCYFLTPQGMTYVINEYLDEPEMAISPEVSPILMKDFSNLLKALIIEAEFSILIDSIKAYHQKIIEANGDSQLNVIKNDVHGFFTGVVGSDENIAECFNLIADFISKF